MLLLARGQARSPVDHDSLEHLRRQVPARQALHPVVAPGDRPGLHPQVLRQGRPHHDEVKVTRVIGKEDPLRVAFDRRSEDCSRSADQLRQPDERPRDHRLSRSDASSERRRTSVTTEPAPITTSASHTARVVPAIEYSTAPTRHPSVITNIRCCFAIGPMKRCCAPRDPASSRTYAVSTARSAADQPSVNPNGIVTTAYPAPTKTATSTLHKW